MRFMDNLLVDGRAVRLWRGTIRPLLALVKNAPAT
jgi:hypothetical protein